MRIAKYVLILLLFIFISCQNNDSTFLLKKWQITGIESLEKEDKNDKKKQFRMAYLNQIFALKTYEFDKDNKYQAIIKDHKTVNGTFEYNKNDNSLVLKANNKKEEYIVIHHTDTTLLLEFVVEPLLMKMKVAKE
ncbi:MAG: DUF4923 family protein [Bacteroidetes bacterium]|nr:DUF4923 family protein [Bacteroidota bacterium]MBT6686325.1 DUF4923 family protein [Bacteroidota bacterium]MBT7142158.1 DUF4923 family protein [Bacteroidota bacterium]